MASKIEHIVKHDAYTDALLWAMDVDHESTVKWLAEKADAHKKYLEEIRTKKAAYYATAPKNRFLNWLGHKCLAWAWGGNSYMAITLNQTNEPRETI